MPLKPVGVYNSFPGTGIYSPEQSFWDQIRIYKEVPRKDGLNQESLITGHSWRKESKDKQ